MCECPDECRFPFALYFMVVVEMMKLLAETLMHFSFLSWGNTVYCSFLAGVFAQSNSANRHIFIVSCFVFVISYFC